MRKLRVHNLLVQVNLLWDDGEELTPGPATQALSFSNAAAVRGWLDSIPDEIAKLQPLDVEEAVPDAEGNGDA